MFMYLYIYIYMYMYIHIHVYIYIYIARERERDHMRITCEKGLVDLAQAQLKEPLLLRRICKICNVCTPGLHHKIFVFSHPDPGKS